MSEKRVTQERNIAGRDIAGRDIITKYGEESPLGKLREKLNDEIKNQIKFNGTLEELKHYETPISNEKVIGLEEKLKLGGRQDLITEAIRCKEIFAKQLARRKLYKSAQEIYILLLEVVKLLFTAKIKPLIISEEPSYHVDQVMAEQILAIMRDMVKENTDLFKPSEIQGMLYFLTGNCHICWHKD